MAHKCINTRDLIKSNEHWRFVQWVICLNIYIYIYQKAFILEKGSLGETPMTGFHTCHLHV